MRISSYSNSQKGPVSISKKKIRSYSKESLKKQGTFSNEAQRNNSRLQLTNQAVKNQSKFPNEGVQKPFINRTVNSSLISVQNFIFPSLKGNGKKLLISSQKRQNKKIEYNITSSCQKQKIINKQNQLPYINNQRTVQKINNSNLKNSFLNNKYNNIIQSEQQLNKNLRTKSKLSSQFVSFTQKQSCEYQNHQQRIDGQEIITQINSTLSISNQNENQSFIKNSNENQSQNFQNFQKQNQQHKQHKFNNKSNQIQTRQQFENRQNRINKKNKEKQTRANTISRDNNRSSQQNRQSRQSRQNRKILQKINQNNNHKFTIKNHNTNFNNKKSTYSNSASNKLSFIHKIYQIRINPLGEKREINTIVEKKLNLIKNDKIIQTENQNGIEGQRQNKSVQVDLINQSDFLDYLKFREKFVQSFSKLENKLCSLTLEETFSTPEYNFNLQQVIQEYKNKIWTLPVTPRQERLIKLAKETHDLSSNLSFNIKNLQKQHIKIAQNFLLMKQKHLNQLDSIIQKINDLQLEPQIKNDDTTKKISILNKLLDKVFKNAIRFNQTYQHKLNKISQSVENVVNKFTSYKKLEYENQFLVYNCVKKLESLPELIYGIFADLKYEIQGQSTENMTKEEKMKKVLGMKCLDCYKKNEKIRYLLFKCEQSKQITQALHYLLKDPTKRQNFAQQVGKQLMSKLAQRCFSFLLSQKKQQQMKQ